MKEINILTECVIPCLIGGVAGSFIGHWLFKITYKWWSKKDEYY